MKNVQYWLLVCLLLIEAISVNCIRHSVRYMNNLDNLRQPTVGIVTLPSSHFLRRLHPDAAGMIASSYVKWVEQTGARAVVIPHFASKKELRYLVRQVNGLMFTGGAVKLRENYIHIPTKTMKKMAYIYKLGLKQNKKNGGNFPIWGTCLGFEMMLNAESKFKAKFHRVNSFNVLKPITFIEKNYRGSVFEPAFRPEVMQYFQTHNSSYFNHHSGMRMTAFYNDKKLTRTFKAIGYYKKNGTKYLGIIQHKKYPIVGVQFHPEKLLFEHKRRVNVNLTKYTSMASQEMSRILFEPTLRNMNMFDNQIVLNRYLISNFASLKYFSVYESLYLFTRHHFDWQRYGSLRRPKKWLKTK